MSARAGDQPLGPLDRDALFAPLEQAPHILVAVSGGPDSTALLGLFAAWARERVSPHLSAATVDHGLRPEATGEAEAVAHLCGRLVVPHATLRWTHEGAAATSQEAARRARYRLLVGEARRIGATHLATAHHADDQAETLLMRMAAGSGLSGLAGMRPVTERDGVLHVRPLLACSKARLVATCRAEGWDFVTDPSNAAERFARPRWRRLMPALAAEGLDGGRFATLAGRLARAEDALAMTAEAAFRRARRDHADEAVCLAMDELAALPTEVALRVVALAVAAERPAGAGEHPMRLERLEACHAALDAAFRAGRTLRRTLAGRVLSLDAAGLLVVTREGPRRRGRGSALTLPALEPPRSLGTEARRT